MQRHLISFKEFLKEIKDPSYYQETFSFTMLISMTKDKGGSRDETKNDIRALPEVLTVTLVEREKGGVQKDLGTKYLSTLKVHVRRPRDISKDIMMKRVVKLTGRLTGVSVLRYKERKPQQRKKVFHGPGSYKITENGYQQSPSRKANLRKGFNMYTKLGPQKKGGYPHTPKDPDWESAPPDAPGGLEETQLDEAMKTAADLPEDVVVVVKSRGPQSFSVYYALRDTPEQRLREHDPDRQEAGIDIYGTLDTHISGEEPHLEVFMVKTATARDGFGPLLYDVALEVAGPQGLRPDEFDVSRDASGVWKHYDTNRPDVDSRLLDDRLARARNNHLVKAYSKKDTITIDDLKSQDKYVEVDASDGPLYEGRPNQLLEDVLITIGAPEDDLMAFDIQPDLNQKIWDGDREVRPGAKGALMDIVDEFLEGLDMDLDIKDVVVTGSIANYNWSKFSDIDLHILVDFSEVNENKEMVKKFFDAVRSNWNKMHNILIKGHEVEIYVQDEHEPHISTGVYSLVNDRWLVKPKKVRPAIDRHTATKKMKQMAREIGKLAALYDNREYQESFDLATKIKDKLKRMRRSGLDRSGIYAPENLAFKMLRRSGDLEQLFGTYTQSYDKLHSVDQ